MYGKHFEKMYTGSLLGAGAEVFAVMGYVISHQKPPDFTVEINPKLVSVMLGEPEEEIRTAVEFLCAPDPNSRSEKEEGRRLKKIGQFLYHVVNGESYHGIKSQEELRAYWREQKRQKKASESKSEPSEKLPNLTAIYDAYPKKTARPKALSAIEKAVDEFGYDLVLEKTKAYAAARVGEDPQFTPYPASWFNAQMFNDDPATWKNTPQKPQDSTDRNAKNSNSLVGSQYSTIAKAYPVDLKGNPL